MTALFHPQKAGIHNLFRQQLSGGLVQPPIVNAVIVTPPVATIKGGETYQFSASVIGNVTISQEVTWQTSIGSIDATGKITAPNAKTEIQLGEVTARSVIDPTKIGRAVFTVPALPIIVTPPDVIDIVLTPARTLRTAANNWRKRIDYVDDNKDDTFYIRAGVWVIDKDPNDELYYALDIIPYLNSINSTISGVVCLTKGVDLLLGPFIRDQVIIVKIGGGDPSSNIKVENSVTFRISCSNGEILDRTIYFALKDN